MDGLQKMTMEVLMANHKNDKLFKVRLENLKSHLTAIAKDHEKRAKVIFDNEGKYSDEGKADQRAALDLAIRQRTNELVDGYGFAKEISEAEKALEVPEPDTELAALHKLLRLQEIRRIMLDSDDRFQELFVGKIMEGDADTIAAIESSPVDFPVDDQTLELGKQRRLEILNPIATERLRALRAAQATLEGMAAQTRPYGSDSHDPLRDIMDT